MSPSSYGSCFSETCPQLIMWASKSHDYLTLPLSPFEWTEEGLKIWDGPIRLSSEIFRIGLRKSSQPLRRGETSRWLQQQWGSHFVFQDLRKRECSLQKGAETRTGESPGYFWFPFSFFLKPSSSLGENSVCPCDSDLFSLLATVSICNLHAKILKKYRRYVVI